MAAERYLSRRIPDLRVGNDIDRIDKKQIQVILWSMPELNNHSLSKFKVTDIHNLYKNV